MIDITVHHENGDYLENGRREKINKYSILPPQAKKRFEASQTKVIPIIVGSRGGCLNLQGKT